MFGIAGFEFHTPGMTQQMDKWVKKEDVSTEEVITPNTNPQTTPDNKQANLDIREKES